MTNHILHSFDERIKAIGDNLETMSDLINQIIPVVIDAWKNKNVEAITRIKTLDHCINVLDNEIEQKSYNVMALHQPVGIDLRVIVSSLKLSVTLERMGDLLKSVARRVFKVSNHIIEEIQGEFISILQIINNNYLLVKPLVRFEASDKNWVEISNEVLQTHEILKILMSKIKGLFAENNSKQHDFLINMVLAVKSMERFCECITKISRIYQYVQTGEKVFKHQVNANVEEI